MRGLFLVACSELFGWNEAVPERGRTFDNSAGTSLREGLVTVPVGLVRSLRSWGKVAALIGQRGGMPVPFAASNCPISFPGLNRGRIWS